MIKKILLLAALVLSMGVQAEVIYLNNGSVINATVVENNGVNLTLRTANGQTLVYPLTEVNRIGESQAVNVGSVVADAGRNLGNNHSDYSTYEKGFFFAVESRTGISMNFAKDKKNIGFTEVDLVGGYRFNQYLKLGLGFGPRYYINGDKLRHAASEWAMPLYLNVRGNFIPHDYRDIVPYYSVDFGGVFPDGVMFRPTIGVRFGSERSAFLLGVSYMGQNLRTAKVTDGGLQITRDFTSFAALTLGYEF